MNATDVVELRAVDEGGEDGTSKWHELDNGGCAG